MKTKTLARIASVQSLYQYIVCSPIAIDILITNISNYYDTEYQKEGKYNKMNLEFFYDILKFALSNLEKLDEIIKENLASNWNINSIHLTLLSVLRSAIAELIFFPETPTKVIISEYTTISTTILSSGEENFVNAILHNIAKKLRTEIKNEV